MNGFEKSRVVFETWRVNVLCSLTRHFKLFSTREYERVPANCLGRLKKCWGVGGGTFRWTSILSRGSGNTPIYFLLPGDLDEL